MGRLKRIAFPGAWYHIFNRGNGRKTVFFSDSHYHYFLNLIHKMHTLHGLEIHSFCLMKNHFHFLAHTPNGNISKIIHHLGSVFSKKINKELNSEGPLFKDRFRSILVDQQSYFLRLVRYIHLNPVEAGYTDQPEKYKWSSYHEYLKFKTKYPFLKTHKALNFFKNKKEFIEYTNLKIDSELKNFYTGKQIKSILGSQNFIDSLPN